MLSRLRRFAMSSVLALSSFSGVALAMPSSALAGTCSVTFLIGPYVSENAQRLDILQSSAQVNCPSYGRGGDKVQLQIIRTTTGAIVATRTVGPCGFGCDFHHINVVAQSGTCNSSLGTNYYSRVRVWYDDKFGWEPWFNGGNKYLYCRF